MMASSGNAKWRTWGKAALCLAVAVAAGSASAQQPAPGDRGPDNPPPFGPGGRGEPGGFGPGGPGGPGGFGGPGGPMGMERKLIPQFDKDGDHRLNREERQAAREFIKKNPQGGGFGRGGRGGGPGGPGGFGPAMMLVPQVLSQGDANADGKLTKDEFTALADRWFDKLDADKAGRLTEEKFAEGFGELLPPPQGFGGGGPQGGPPGGNGGPLAPGG